MVKYTLTKNCLHIEDSCKISKDFFADTIYDIQIVEQDKGTYSDVWRRDIWSLKSEWAVHNFLYRLGLWKSRTKDVDLDYPADKPEWLYKFLGAIVWIFIK